MGLKKGSILGILGLVSLLGANAEVLTWKANTGQQYETRVTVKEYVTGLDSITSQPVTVTDAAPYQEAAAQNQSTIAHLKHLVTFPRGSLEQGNTWEGEVEISYDLTAFGFKDPLVLTVPITYAFLGMSSFEGKDYYHVTGKWVPFYIVPEKDAKRSNIERLSGISTIDLLWDNRSGSPKQSRVVEELQYRFADKTSLLYTRETAEEFNTVTEIVRASIVSQLQEQIREQKVENVEVRETEAGIVLSIENIQFEPDSAVLVETEKTKLANIGAVLKTLTGRKLSIIGHAANPAGSNEAELLELSTARAQSVADFLVESGIKSAEEVLASGKGGSEPIDTNETPEGRSRNRRVEIIILDEEAAQ